MLYDVIAVDFIPELCVFQLNAKLKPSYIPRCGIFLVGLIYRWGKGAKFKNKYVNICYYPLKVGHHKMSNI